MAWRDSRRYKGRMCLFVLSIAIGVAALVALGSFWINVKDAINDQARALLGADLQVQTRQELSPDVHKVLDKISGDAAVETKISTMAFFPHNNGSRLAQVRAMRGDFPFYGEIVTDPPTAIDTLRSSQTPLAIAEESLLLQFDAAVGDTIRIGNQPFEVAGRLLGISGETVSLTQLAPRLLINAEHLPATGLIQPGSRVFYRYSYKLGPDFDKATIVTELEALSEVYGFRVETPESRKESLGKRLSRLFSFLGLVGFAALLLAGIGIGSSVHVYIRRKMATVATLRCLGAQRAQTFAIYLIQAAVMGLLGGVLGACAGAAVQHYLPGVMAAFIPAELDPRIVWPVAAAGVAVGLAGTMLFALGPLLALRDASPLLALRADFETTPSTLARFLTPAIVVATLITYALLSAQSIKHGVMLAGGLLGVFAILLGVGKITMVLLRKTVSQRLPFCWRQGLQNLYRPQNQTIVLVLVLGIGTFMLMTLHLTQRQVLGAFDADDTTNHPNMVLFDIQPDQLVEVRTILDEMSLPMLQEVPMISMRLAKINGVRTSELRQSNSAKPESQRIPKWALNRQYRSTFRDHLIDTETLTAGKFTGRFDNASSKPIPVSVEAGIAKDLKIKLGDSLTFNVQGIEMKTVVDSLREVDWYRVQPNFFVVFPVGVLEPAPQTIVAVTKVPDAATSAALQRATVSALPNVSLIDLTLVLKSLSGMLDNIRYAVEFMAIFSIITGLIVLTASLQLTRYQRLRESVLLKVLGASRRQVLSVVAAEHLLLGLLGANTGILLAVGASWALGRFMFETPFFLDWPALIVGNVAVVAVTFIVGMLNSIDVYRKAPLEALRRET